MLPLIVVVQDNTLSFHHHVSLADDDVIHTVKLKMTDDVLAIGLLSGLLANLELSPSGKVC